MTPSSQQLDQRYSHIEKVLLSLLVLIVAAVFAYIVATTVFSLIAHRGKFGEPRTYRVGILQRSSVFNDSIKGFQEALLSADFDGSIQYTVYNSYGDDQLMRFQAEQLVQRNVDLILGLGTGAALEVQSATKETSIPGLFFATPNPVELGLIQSYSQSGTNLVGIGGSDTIPHQLELLKQLLPEASTLGIIRNPGDVSSEYFVSTIAAAAPSLELSVETVDIRTPDDIGPAFDALTAAKVSAIFLTPSGAGDAIAQEIANEATERKLLLMGNGDRYTELGAVFSYFADVHAIGETLGTMAARILQGTSPSTMASTFPTVSKLTFNSTRAKMIGLVIPEALLTQADAVYD